MLEERKWATGSTEKRIRLKSPSPSPSPSLQQGVKDVCVCVRLIYPNEDGCIKWLRFKIPGTMIEEFGITDTTDDPCISTVSHSSLACSSLMGKETEMEMEMETPRDKDEHNHKSPCSDASSTEYELNDPNSVTVHGWREIRCRLHPINGPFHFTPLVKNRFCYPRFARCAALGSVIYALGGDYDNIGDRRRDYINDDDLNFPIHNGRPPKRTITGPPVCGGRPSTSLGSTSPRPNSNVDTCHRFHLCDFSKEIPNWQVSPHPLITPRFSPKLLSFDGKIYAFGGTHPTDKEASFVEVYDPDLGFWEAIPNPPFGRLSDCELFVFPLPKSSYILVLGAYSQISYKLDTLSWMWLPFDGCTGLDIRLYGQFKRGSSPVIFDDTIYWMHRDGPLCAYRLGKGQAKGKYYEGFITGFEGLQIEFHLNETFDFPLALLPISRHLLGLFWCSTAAKDFGFYYGSCLHISLLRVSLLRELELYDHSGDFPDPSLTASVVTTLTFPFPMDSINIIDACFIDDEEIGKLLSSCIDVEA